MDSCNYTYSKRLKPEAKVFAYFFKAINYKAVAIITNCSKGKEELHYKGKNFRRSITPHHTYNKKQNRVVAVVRVQRLYCKCECFSVLSGKIALQNSY
jgi:hypothetical protein